MIQYTYIDQCQSIYQLSRQPDIRIRRLRNPAGMLGTLYHIFTLLDASKVKSVNDISGPNNNDTYAVFEYRVAVRQSQVSVYSRATKQISKIDHAMSVVQKKTAEHFNLHNKSEARSGANNEQTHQSDLRRRYSS